MNPEASRHIFVNSSKISMGQLTSVIHYVVANPQHVQVFPFVWIALVLADVS